MCSSLQTLPQTTEHQGVVPLNAVRAAIWRIACSIKPRKTDGAEQMIHAGIREDGMRDPVRRNKTRSEVFFMKIAIVAAMLLVAFSSFPLAARAQHAVVGISSTVNR
jgi:hypothetical protein